MNSKQKPTFYILHFWVFNASLEFPHRQNHMQIHTQDLSISFQMRILMRMKTIEGLACSILNVWCLILLLHKAFIHLEYHYIYTFLIKSMYLNICNNKLVEKQWFEFNFFLFVVLNINIVQFSGYNSDKWENDMSL